MIQDHRYADKLAWFSQRTEHRFVLMPHRCEQTVANVPQRFLSRANQAGRPGRAGVGQRSDVTFHMARRMAGWL